MNPKQHLSALQRIALAVAAGYITAEQALIYIAALHAPDERIAANRED
jgi:hypothetical protein